MLVSQAGDKLQGDVSLESNALLLDTLAKESQDHKALTLPPPKLPAPALTTLVSSKKPIQNPQPTGRGRVKFKGKGHFSGQSAHRGKGRGARKGRNVPDVRTPACMKAPEVPPLTVRDRCRPLGHAHRTMGVQDPLCDAAATETSGTRDHIPQGVLKWSSLSQSVQELRNKGAIEPAPGLLQPIVPCSQGNRGVEADHTICPPSMSSCIARASLWRHLGQSSGPLNRASG